LAHAASLRRTFYFARIKFRGFFHSFIALIRLAKANGELMALIANYAMHGTVFGSTNTQITGDAPGVVAEYVELKLGAAML
jgi:hypothetical protein